ncbi:polyprenyl synthetase family protein [Spirochaetota bacterium]
MKQDKTDIKEILYPLNDSLKEVDEIIKQKLLTGIPLVDESAMYLFDRGGKRIRASLLLLASGIKGNIADGAERVGAAAEIIHAATLIHDDIIDQSILRRGDVAVPQKWGNKVAVLAGDYMYTVAMDITIAEGITELLSVMASGTMDMVKGELYQMQFSNIDTISREHYYNIIELKTANYMGCCTRMGAILAGFDKNECDQLYWFGKNLGYAFQIIDDNLDVVQEKSTTGKDAGNDFLDGKITLPFIYLLEKSDSNEQKRLKEYALNPNIDNWIVIKDLILEMGAVEYANSVAHDYIDKAMKIIGQFPETECRGILEKLSHFLGNRNY